MKLFALECLMLLLDLGHMIFEIREEFKDQAEPAEKDVLLPERVGGSKVQLLLGIKNTNLDPVLVKILPSGVAIYRSSFKSRMIFAGPHKSFTKDDNGVNMSNAVFFYEKPESRTSDRRTP